MSERDIISISYLLQFVCQNLLRIFCCCEQIPRSQNTSPIWGAGDNCKDKTATEVRTWQRVLFVRPISNTKIWRSMNNFITDIHTKDSFAYRYLRHPTHFLCPSWCHLMLNIVLDRKSSTTINKAPNILEFVDCIYIYYLCVAQNALFWFVRGRSRI